MEDSASFIQKMMELGIGMSMIRQMPAMVEGVLPNPASQPSASVPPAVQPSSPQQTVWYLAINGSQYGPCDVSALRQMLATGQVSDETLAWSAGMASWQPMKEIPALRVLFTPASDAVPPPIPNIPPIPGK